LYALTLAGHNGAAFDVTVHNIDGVVIIEFQSTAHISADGHDYFTLSKQSVHHLQSA